MAGAGAIKAGEAFVRVFSDDAPLIKSLRGIESQYKKLGQGISQVGGQVAGLGAGVASIGGIGLAALAWPLQLASNMENSEAAFTTLLKDVDAARKLMGELQQFAASTPFQFDELADAGKKLLAFGSAAGDIQNELRQIGDISSAIGAPIGEIAEIYGKARVQGRLFAEDINQLTGRGIPIIQELAKQFGVTDQEIKAMVEDGQVNFGNLEKAFTSLTNEGGKFAGGMERQSKTLSGSFSTLKDNIIAAFRPFGEVLLPVAKTALSVASSVIARFAEFASSYRGIVIPIAAALVAITAVGAAAAATGVALMFVGSAISAIGAVSGAVATLTAAIGAPVLIVAAKVVAVLAVITGAAVAIGAAFAYVLNEAGLLGPAITFIKNAVGELFGTFKTTFGGILNALGSGEWGLAAQIAWAGVKLATLQGTKSVLQGIQFLWANAGAITLKFFEGLGRVVYKVFASLPKIALSALRGGAAFAGALQKALSGAFEGGDLASGLDPAIENAQKKLDELVLRVQPKAEPGAANVQASPQVAAIAAAPQTVAAFQPPPEIMAAPRLATAPAPTYTGFGVTAGGIADPTNDPMAAAEEQRRHFAYLTGEAESPQMAQARPPAITQAAAVDLQRSGSAMDLEQLIETAQQQLFVLRRIEQSGLN